MDNKITAGEALTPKPLLARELGISSRTLSRWMEDAALAFPQPVRIRGRLFFARSAIETWKAARLRASISGEAA